MQQNKFCGIVLKNRALASDLPSAFRCYSGTYYLMSEMDDAFDGIKTKSLEAWSSAKLVDDNIVLSTDRVGVRSMYYKDCKDYFCFANTLLSLKKIPFLRLEVSKSGALDFFIKGKTSGLLENVSNLKSGSILKYNLSKFSYKISEPTIISIDTRLQSDEEVEVETRNLIDSTMEDLISHLPMDKTASFLSGGIDSSVIASVIKHRGIDLPFITAMTGNHEMDEIGFAQDVVSSLDLKDWHQVMVQNIDKEIENLHLAMELPTTSMGTYMQYELMRFCAHQGIKHVFDGTGADALYAGHKYYLPIYWNTLIRKREFAKLKNEITYWNGDSSWISFYIKNMMLYYYIPRFSSSSRMRFHVRNNKLLEGLNSEFSNTPCHSLNQKPSYDLKDLNTFLSNDFFGGGVKELLRFTDRIGKSFGVCSHPVFALNSNLYQSALAISPDLKIRDGISKYLLRSSFADSLPESVLNRKDKMGLVAPNNLWMKENKDLLLSYIDKNLEDFFDVDKMTELLSKAIDQSSFQENYKIFKFFSFAIWHKVMIG